MHKIILMLCFLLFFPMLAFSATPSQNGYFINLDTIKFIVCNDGEASGTGFIIAKNRIVTANHVIYGAKTCSIDQS